MVLKCERRQDEVERLDCNWACDGVYAFITNTVSKSYSMVVGRRKSDDKTGINGERYFRDMWNI